MLSLLMLIFIGATAADFMARRKRGYFKMYGYGNWLLGRLLILLVVALIWYLAIR